MNYEFEKKKLYSLLGKNVLSELKGQKCYIAGGAITSLFCNREINDIDIYFKSETAFVDFVTSIWEDGGRWIVANTSKATLVKLSKNDEIQMIHFKYFPKAEDIFETFDFTVCMGAFDFETETFHFHPDFMQHNSQRILKFNKNTAFPIVSLLRVQKYKDKGYTISKPEFIRIALTCMNLNINTYEELKEQLGGMYGVNYDKLFENKDGDVNLDEAIDAIANLCLDDDYFKTPQSYGKEMGDIEEFLDNIVKAEIPYIKIKEDVYRIFDGKLSESKNAPKYGGELNIDDYFKDKKYYKFVFKKSDGKYYSYYDKSFEYRIGEEVVAKKKVYGSQEPVLYFNDLEDINKSTYQTNKDKVLIEVSFKPEDFVELNGGTVTLRKCTTIREVPEDEYKQYLE